MEFYCCSMHSPEEYKEIILSHEGTVKTEQAAWFKALESGKKVWPYSASMVPEEPNDDTVIYFEFVDDDLNLYVDFFHIKNMEWIESYKFTDKNYAWTIFIDNIACGNPLALQTSKLQELLINFELAEDQKECLEKLSKYGNSGYLVTKSEIQEANAKEQMNETDSQK